MLPWVKINANGAQRAQQAVTWGKPLTKSYPIGTMLSTVGSGQPSPGMPSTIQRVTKTGLQTSGDPRATGGFYQINTNSSLQSLIAGLPPTTENVGGNSYSNPVSALTSTSGGMTMILLVVGIVIALFLWNK